MCIIFDHACRLLEILLCSFSSTDLKFCSCSDDGTVKVWDFARCQEERSLAGKRICFCYFFIVIVSFMNLVKNLTEKFNWKYSVTNSNVNWKAYNLFH